MNWRSYRDMVDIIGSDEITIYTTMEGNFGDKRSESDSNEMLEQHRRTV